MSLRDLAERAGVGFGTCASIEDFEVDWYGDLLAREFTRLSVENDLMWSRARPDPEAFDFEDADTIVDFADRHGLSTSAHSLVWHQQNPDWLTETDWERDELADQLRTHVHRVTDRYDGRIDTWDVVNEAVADDGTLRENLWLEHLGEEYVADAFRWAAERTDATLLYNDYALPYNEGKRERVYRLLRDLLDRGVPVDGVGLQLHCVWAHPTPAAIRETVERFRDLGLDVRVTELDVAFDADDPPADLDAAHADYYRQTVEACLDAGVDHVTLWGATDRNSWITKWRDLPEQFTQRPMLFDEDGREKESYDAVVSVLREHA
jgi:endo-1,4-beta-xylanase